MNVDERIQSAGSRLASTPVAVPDLERLMRRRSLRVRASAVAGSVAVISLGVVVLVGHDSNREQSVTEPVATPETVAVDAPAGRYELALEGATPLPVESLTARSTDTAVWSDEAAQTYLTLIVRPGAAPSTREPSGLGYMVEDTSFPVTQGRAWFTSTDDALIRQMTMWWSRPNGDLWLLNSFWYGQEATDNADGRRALREWALAISAPEPVDEQRQYRLAGSSMRILATDQGGDVESRAQVWSYQHGSVVDKITLLSLQGTVASGRANLLARGKPEQVRIDGYDAWQVTDSTTGEIQIGWPTEDTPPEWLTLTIPATLESLTPQIRAALQSR